MKLLQAHWDATGWLILWGESAQRFPEERLPGDESAKHPFACSREELEDGLIPLEIGYDRQDEIQILLPSDDYGPLASPRFFTAKSDTITGRLRLERWNVPALFFGPLNALTLLTSISSRTSSPMKYDDSVSFWLEVTKFVLELLTRGRFVPGIHEEKSSYRSHWHLVSTREEDKQRLKILSEAMPPLCRSPLDVGSSEMNPSALVESFVTSTADALIRYFLKNKPMFVDTVRSPLSPKQEVTKNWLLALNRENPVVVGPEYELVKLEQRLKRWSGPLIPTSAHDVRTAFRLIPPQQLAQGQLAQGLLAQENQTGRLPTEKKALWHLEFLLQSLAHPTKLLAAHQLWQGDVGFLRGTEHSLDELEDKLLGDLGKASNTFRPLLQALSDPAPGGVFLDVEEAYTFLREVSPLFEQAGFGVLLPGWWKKPSLRLGLHLNVSSDEVGVTASHSRAPSSLGLDQLLNFSWQVSLGTERLGLDQFRALVEERTPLVEYHGEWIELRPKEVESALTFLENQHNVQKIRLLDALHLGVGLEAELLGLPVVGFSAQGWIQKLLDAQVKEIPVIDQPRSFCGDLRPYQLQGLSWLSFLEEVGCGACLADDMGLGKTIQFLSLLLREREDRCLVDPVGQKPGKLNPSLLIVPMSILDNWEREARKFAPTLRVWLHHGTNRLSRDALKEKIRDIDLFVTTYSLAYRDESSLASILWGRIALDEAQNIKNLNTKQTQAIRRLLKIQLGRHALALNDGTLSNNTGGIKCSRLALTGTPLENHLEELWSILDFLNPGFLGSVGDFRAKFAVPIERYRSSEVAEKLARLVRPFILRRLKSDPSVIDDLPEKIEMEVITHLTQEQAVLYQQVVDSMLPEVDRLAGIQRKGLILATITRLKQICNHPALYLKDNSALENRSGKLLFLEELLEVILAENDKVLIFTQYAQLGHLLKPYLQERFNQEVLFLHGAMSKGGRDDAVTRFQQADGKGPSIFILSLKAGGFGLNLTAANQIIHFDQWWNPAVQEQASDRAYRIGQKRNVQVRKFICQGTLEERIAELLNSKRNLASSIVGETKNVITELSSQELKRLLELSQETVFTGDSIFGDNVSGDTV